MGRYTKNDPKWVQAESVEYATPDGLYVNVTAYGETFTMCHISGFNILDPSESSILVQNARGDWLKVRFKDEDIKPYEEPDFEVDMLIHRMDPVDPDFQIHSIAK